MGYGILVLKNNSKVEVWRTIVRAQGYTNQNGREEIQIHGGRQSDNTNPYLWNTGGG